MPMRRRHLRSVLRIESTDVHPGWSLGLFMSELSRQDDRAYLVAKVGSAVVAFAGMLYADDDAHITTIAVDPPWRGRRIATRLVLELARRARSDQARAMTLEVRTSNDAAIALYRTFGFGPVGVRKNYYADLGEDALIMWAHDIQEPAFQQRLDAIERSLPAPSIIDEIGR